VKTKSKAFGEEHGENFKIGDLVMWTDVSVLGLPFEKRETVNYGLLVAKKIKKVGGREVCFARVMPMSKDTIYEVSMITIKKFEEDKI
tara:strand:- start:957 stop:1220 length:264 start_codon:yes stop_codon:yes gene_type:complete